MNSNGLTDCCSQCRLKNSIRNKWWWTRSWEWEKTIIICCLLSFFFPLLRPIQFFLEFFFDELLFLICHLLAGGFQSILDEWSFITDSLTVAEMSLSVVKLFWLVMTQSSTALLFLVVYWWKFACWGTRIWLAKTANSLLSYIIWMADVVRKVTDTALRCEITPNSSFVVTYSM